MSLKLILFAFSWKTICTFLCFEHAVGKGGCGEGRICNLNKLMTWVFFKEIDKIWCKFFVLQVIMEPKNALGKQYKKMFNMNNVSFHSLVCMVAFVLASPYLPNGLCWIADVQALHVVACSLQSFRSNYFSLMVHWDWLQRKQWQRTLVPEVWELS